MVGTAGGAANAGAMKGAIKANESTADKSLLL
jgi:hypothetical protein